MLKRQTLWTTTFVLSAGLLGTANIGRAQQVSYEVTITNLTRGQSFTPILVASHQDGLHLFALGEPASSELATLAEEGNTGPLESLLLANPAVKDTAVSSGLTGPGQTATVVVKGEAGFNRLSLAAMLIPTNDAFFALDNMAAPRGEHTLTLYSPAYDAGSERNDELCASIPGPNFAECGGPGGGGQPSGGEEGYVHVHAGMHGIGDFDVATRDWRNPVAKIDIRRLP